MAHEGSALVSGSSRGAHRSKGQTRNQGDGARRVPPVSMSRAPAWPGHWHSKPSTPPCTWLAKSFQERVCQEPPFWDTEGQFLRPLSPHAQACPLCQRVSETPAGTEEEWPGACVHDSLDGGQRAGRPGQRLGHMQDWLSRPPLPGDESLWGQGDGDGQGLRDPPANLRNA